jgi:hypothetical protein
MWFVNTYLIQRGVFDVFFYNNFAPGNALKCATVCECVCVDVRVFQACTRAYTMGGPNTPSTALLIWPSALIHRPAQ